ncbi:hypothetical protein WJ05_17775 [Burkholderia vietnamiensis]|uniref:type II toxin-antitoxin system RelE/ParE family toxin n=1 Tax=Burkholderia vietnamiensis TaxID=60552 RepID=UPI0007569312|nr:type II toxin-antitoxin system RelE/ParE family toxin [Burkholderia vietnamiensis]KVF09672.1 hypothetical protein WJ05_17775 [Burkholderia vietnamiensis]HDR9126249.1 type II toxin-antitoxin system RelE/ParE family toxin [Burkholderia vietnamiensis]
MLRYYVFENDKLKVAALAAEGEAYGPASPVLTFLQQKSNERQYSASAKGFKSVFKRFAAGERLPVELFHEADKAKKVWEFIKGDLRVFGFRDVHGNVMLTGACIKKGQKADSTEVERAFRARTEFGDKAI